MHDLSTAAEEKLSERAERDAEAGGMGKTGEGKARPARIKGWDSVVALRIQ
jgi:hypothetical protein